MKNSANFDKEHSLILTDDALVLFEIAESNGTIGKIIFWGTLYSITEVQINKMQKIANLKLMNDESLAEEQLNLKIDNILLFREALVKRMTNLKVQVEAKRINKGQSIERRITEKDIKTMNIDQIITAINSFKLKLERNEVNYYTVNTFMNLCTKAVEHYSLLNNDESHMYYLDTMKSFLTREDIQKALHGEAQ